MDLSYEREDWGLPLRDPNEPEFLALNPNGLPVLIDDGLKPAESVAQASMVANTIFNERLPRKPPPGEQLRSFAGQRRAKSFRHSPTHGARRHH
jgi:glutathione S-transferase